MGRKFSASAAGPYSQGGVLRDSDSHSGSPRADPEDQRRALERLLAAESILITGHQSPDGDVVGSAAVLLTALRQAARANDARGAQRPRQVQVVLPDPAPNYLSELLAPFSFQVFGEGRLPEVDLVCLVDATDMDRMGPLGVELFGGQHPPDLLVIDHHLPAQAGGVQGEGHSPRRFWYLDPSAAATSILTLEIAEALQVDLTPAAADAGLMALISDTGGFRFESTDARAFESAARFVRAGARPDRISEATRGRDEPGRPHQLARLLECSTYRAGGRIAFLALPAEVLARLPDVDPAAAYETLRSVRRRCS